MDSLIFSLLRCVSPGRAGAACRGVRAMQPRVPALTCLSTGRRRYLADYVVGFRHDQLNLSLLRGRGEIRDIGADAASSAVASRAPLTLAPYPRAALARSSQS